MEKNYTMIYYIHSLEVLEVHLDCDFSTDIGDIHIYIILLINLFYYIENHV